MDRSIIGKIKINSYEDVIGGDSSDITEIALCELHSFKDHPFKVRDDKKMYDLVESVKKHGVLVPGVARSLPAGGYEIISGHRRKRACELAGLTTMPVIIKNYSDDEAILVMIDSNLQRDMILPSEKAFSYKMMLEALKRTAGRPSKENSCQVGTNFRADEKLANSFSDSARTIQRYIRLTELLPDLLDMVDIKKLKFSPAVEISYLTLTQQEILIKVMEEDFIVPSLKQAKQLRELSQEMAFTKASVHALLSSSKDKERKIIIRQDIIKRYFSPDTSDEEIESLICSLLDNWQKDGGTAWVKH